MVHLREQSYGQVRALLGCFGPAACAKNVWRKPRPNGSTTHSLASNIMMLKAVLVSMEPQTCQQLRPTLSCWGSTDQGMIGRGVSSFPILKHVKKTYSAIDIFLGLAPRHLLYTLLWGTTPPNSATRLLWSWSICYLNVITLPTIPQSTQLNFGRAGNGKKIAGMMRSCAPL